MPNLLKTLLGSSPDSQAFIAVSLDGSVYVRDENGLETILTAMVGPAGPSAPATTTATSIGVLTTNTAAQNALAYAAWRDNAAFARGTLIFDVPGGTYLFPTDTILVPFSRVLTGVPGVTIKADGASGSWLVRPSGSPFTLQNITLNGGGTAADGSDALVEHLVETVGVLSPPQAGPTLVLVGVHGERARTACFHARSASFIASNISGRRARLGTWLESCSESKILGVSYDNLIETGVLVEGSQAGTNTRSGEAMTNGGRITLRDVIMANMAIGVWFNGVASGGGCDFTCEGSTDTSYKFSYCTNVHLARVRSNAGKFIDFIDSNYCVVRDAGCVSTQLVTYDDLSRWCRVFATAESFAAPVGIEQRWGTAAWAGYITADGVVVSKNNTAPTGGFWEQTMEVRRLTQTSGQPMGWRCSVGGNPGTWVALPNIP